MIEGILYVAVLCMAAASSFCFMGPVWIATLPVVMLRLLVIRLCQLVKRQKKPLLFLPVILILGTIYSTLTIMVRFRRMYILSLSKYYFQFAAALIEHLCETRVLLWTDCTTGNPLDDSPMLIMSNHRTRVDWMYCGWAYAAIHHATKPHLHMSVMLKADLAVVPVFGWLMQTMQYVFLSRDREQDVPSISKAVEHLMRMDRRPCVLLFPEGTDLSDSNLDKSHAFADAKGLPRLHHCLYPKTAGAFTVLEAMKARLAAEENPNTPVDLYVMKRGPRVLHDLTVAYVDALPGVRTDEWCLLAGYFPKQVHIFVSRVELKNIPADYDAFEQWLRARQMVKEKRLSSFYEYLEAKQSTLAYYGGDAEMRDLDLHNKEARYKMNWMFMLRKSDDVPHYQRFFPCLVMCSQISLCLIGLSTGLVGDWRVIASTSAVFALMPHLLEGRGLDAIEVWLSPDEYEENDPPPPGAHEQ